MGGWYTRPVNQDPHPESVPSGPARLEAVAGPLEGKTFPLTEGEFSLAGSRPTRFPCWTLWYRAGIV